MTYQEDMRRVVAEELDIDPADIRDIVVLWDSGENNDPTYGGDNVAPTFEIQVWYYTGTHQTYREVSVEFMFTQLLRRLLGLTP